jgi:hypothetical protein
MTAAVSDNNSPGTDGKETFDKWWDNVNSRKPSESPSTLAPPTWRKPKENMASPVDSRFGEAPAPSPDPMLPSVSRYQQHQQHQQQHHHQQQHQPQQPSKGNSNNFFNGSPGRDDGASMEALKQKMLLMESEFDPSKQSDLPSIRTPNVKTVSVTSAAVNNDSSRGMVEDSPEAKKGGGGGGSFGDEWKNNDVTDNDNQFRNRDQDQGHQFDDGEDRKPEAKDSQDAIVEATQAKSAKKKKKKEKKEKKAKKDKGSKKKDKGLALPPGMAAPLQAPTVAKTVDDDGDGDGNSNSILEHSERPSFLTDWGDSNGPRTDTPTKHLLTEEKTESEGKWEERDLSFLGDSGE